MNQDKLQRLEAYFLSLYPGAFADPALQAVSKKHKMAQMIERSQAAFKKSRFADQAGILEAMVAITGQSSMVSLFEKPRYRDCLRGLGPSEQAKLVDALRKRLHGNAQKGFNEMLELLASYKLGKWTLMSILPLYYRPEQEFFVKPTTAKKIIQYLELDDLHYRPQPSWDFYQRFREHLQVMQAAVLPGLSPNNAAFTGFLMVSIDAQQKP